MTRGRRLVVNATFAGTFLVGALLFWSGVRAFIFSDTDIVHGATELTIGFVLWTVLAGVSGRSTNRQEATR